MAEDRPASGEARRFLCDEMLHGLGRWLRAAGYDTLIARPGEADSALLRQARAEGRWLLTRDRKLLEHRGAADWVILLDCNGVAACASELAARQPVDWLHAPFSRCLECNTPLRPASAAQITTLPEDVQRNGETVCYCPACDKLYWEGGHVRRMRARLAAFAAASGQNHATIEG